MHIITNHCILGITVCSTVYNISLLTLHSSQHNRTFNTTNSQTEHSICWILNKKEISRYSTKAWSSFCTPYVQQSTQLLTPTLLSYLLVQITNGTGKKLMDSHVTAVPRFSIDITLNSHCQTISE